MSIESVDNVQKRLAEEVFGHTTDAKKAAGRALGTIVEIITYQYLRTYNYGSNIAIEKALAEYRNLDITHNVEYSLHPNEFVESLSFEDSDLPITAKKIYSRMTRKDIYVLQGEIKSNSFMDKNKIIKNNLEIYKTVNGFIICCLNTYQSGVFIVDIYFMYKNPFSIFECKRVGIEEGNKKGPQTIEKAKQGAYVAKTISSLQKIRFRDGTLGGILQKLDGSLYWRPYYELLNETISSDEPELLKEFILTVGIISNHGNWFTSSNPNKELKVLSQSYDWLLFLTDIGLSEFVNEMLVSPTKEFHAVKTVFLESYKENKTHNAFTKVKMDLEVFLLLSDYFKKNINRINNWFNFISPQGSDISILSSQLEELKSKNWKEIHK